MKSYMDVVQLRILTPYPGTRLYKRLSDEGRLFEHDWWLQGHPPDTILYQPKGMTVEELISGLRRIEQTSLFYGRHNETIPWHEPHGSGRCWVA